MGRKPIQKDRSRNEEKREKWIRECIKYFDRSGIKNATMDDVAELLDISKATIYNHFKSKDEMVQTAVAMLLNEIREYENILSDRSLPYLMRYYKGMRYYAKKLTGISPRLVDDVKSGYPDLWNYIEMFRNQFSFVIGKYYEEGVTSGILKEFNISVLVGMDRWFLDALLNSDYLQQNDLTLDEAFDQYFKIKFDGAINSNTAEVFNLLRYEKKEAGEIDEDLV